MNGYCYEFASLLEDMYPGGEILYSPVEGHAYYQYDGVCYDINGVAAPEDSLLPIHSEPAWAPRTWAEASGWEIRGR